MAGGAADEPQIRVEPPILEHQPGSLPRPPPRPHGAGEISSPPIPEELLLDIFRRIPDPTDLVLTSAACVTFRRLIADRSFLRQYRKLHAPPLLGAVNETEGFQPAERPYRSAPAARAVARAGDFSFSFVPAPAPPHRLVVMDISDGRVLLGKTDTAFDSGHFYRELVVCDPLHRRYLLLPPIPNDLLASVKYFRKFWDTFLVPSVDEVAIAEETSFRVICMVQSKVKLAAFVFFSSTRQWQAIPSQSWTNLLPPALLPSESMPLFTKRECVFSCFYWLSTTIKFNMLVLDTRRMEFFIAEPRPEAQNINVSIATMVESGEGRPRMLTGGRSSTSGPEYTIWRKHGGSSSQWQKEKIFTTSPYSFYYFRRSVGEYLLLEHYQSVLLELSLCTLDIETLQVKRVCALALDSCAYRNYPPSLSSPTV